MRLFSTLLFSFFFISQVHAGTTSSEPTPPKDTQWEKQECVVEGNPVYTFMENDGFNYQAEASYSTVQLAVEGEVKPVLLLFSLDKDGNGKIYVHKPAQEIWEVIEVKVDLENTYQSVVKLKEAGERAQPIFDQAIEHYGISPDAYENCEPWQPIE